MTDTITSPTIAAFDGGCLCGHIRYRATAAPVRGVICHCYMCRKHSGAPALAFVHFPRESFTWLGAEPTRYDSSLHAQRGFCPTCGSTLSMHEEVLVERVQICVGSLDAPERVRIDDHVWVQQRIDWFEVRDELPRSHRTARRLPRRPRRIQSSTAA